VSVQLKNIGEEEYGGWDEGTPISVPAGDVVTVSDAKAEQLLADFPDWFSTVDAKPPGRTRGRRAT
jgi:hypothetical protein